jgi:hypothetical protein
MSTFQPMPSTYPDLIPDLTLRVRAALPTIHVAQSVTEWDGDRPLVHLRRITGKSNGLIDEVMLQVDVCDPDGIDQTFAIAETVNRLVEQSVDAVAYVARVININRLSWIPEESGLPRFSSTYTLSVLAS